jgi:2-keto-myo-inositol isomerase
MTGPTIYLNGATLMTTPTDRVLAVAREAGFAGIEARAERLLGRTDELRAAANAAAEGEIFSLNGVSLTLRADGSMDRRVLEEDLPPRLAICKDLRTVYLLAVAPRAAGVPSGAAIAGLREALELVADRAARSGVRVAFEFLGFPDCPVNTPARAAELVGRDEGIEVVLDSCHWHASGGQALGDFPVERLALVHLNDAPAKPRSEIEDADRVLPGQGVIALGELVDMLRSQGYSGPWSLETFNPSYWTEDPAEVAGRGLAATRAVLSLG